ncbi:MAG: ABC transporter ATP-binding protein [Clostridia bacterium]|nr:ABC transporter ATP-binding protein [Clostridia bacterium]
MNVHNQSPAPQDSQPAMINLKDIVVRFGDFEALHNINVEVKEGEFFTFLGPSGCGKTTTLRTITGFIEPAGGCVMVGGEDITHVPIEKRNIGIVFQSYALFPTMTVYDNIAFGLRVKKKLRESLRTFRKWVVKQEGLKLSHLVWGWNWKKKWRLFRYFVRWMKGWDPEVDERVREIARKVDLSDEQLQKAVSQLSGGQQQRVAIARALVTGPAIICMDEPLSNLDAKLRVGLRNELKKMQRDFGITTIYVTHDQEEALTLSDRIAVFNNGYIEQIGTPNEVYNHSATEFVCNFIGDINRIEATTAARMGLPEGEHHFVRLERLRVNQPVREDETVFTGRVLSSEYYGLYIKYFVEVDTQVFKVIEKNDGVSIYAAGETVSIGIARADVMSYPAEAMTVDAVTHAQ